MAKAGPNSAAGEDDLAAWRRLTAEVQPLKRPEARGRPPSAGDAPAASFEPPPAPATPKPAAKAPVARPQPPAQTRPPSRPFAPGDAPGLDRRTLARLRRGAIRPELRIDLHSMSQHDAHYALQSFLSSSRGEERRCVLVITGKGRRSEGMVGVLKTNVPRWLNEAPLADAILGFAFATPADGGDGALYVLLRRRRAGTARSSPSRSLEG